MRRKRPTASEHNVIGVYLHSRGMYDLAILELIRASRLAPQSPVIHYNLGAAYFGKKDLDQSLAALKAALELDPNHLKAHLLLAYVLEAKGLQEESREALKWVAARDPSGRCGQEAKEALVSLGSKLTARVAEKSGDR